MQRILKGHPNIVFLIDAAWHRMANGTFEVFILMEFCPGGGIIDMMNRRLRERLTEGEILQIFVDTCEGVAAMHNLRPALLHRDLKVENILQSSATLFKLCDFGSAKILVAGEPIVSYVRSRYYSAPELIFGATNYTTNIGQCCTRRSTPPHVLTSRRADIWSTGCVMAELMLGQPLFPGESGIDQLVEIIKVLGTPSREQIKTMNPNYMEHKFPQIKPHPFSKVCKAAAAATASLCVCLVHGCTR